MSDSKFQGKMEWTAGGEVKTPDGKIHSIPSTKEQIGQTVPASMASVSCGGSIKYNQNTKHPKTGNFIGISLMISANVTLPCRPEHRDQAYSAAESMVSDKILQTRSTFIQNWGLQDWFK